MEEIVKLLNAYGAWGLLFALCIYLVLKGEFVFRYPRSRDRGTKRHHSKPDIE